MGGGTGRDVCDVGMFFIQGLGAVYMEDETGRLPGLDVFNSLISLMSWYYYMQKIPCTVP